MQDHISYTTEHMNSLKALCSGQQSPPEIFVVVSINSSCIFKSVWDSAGGGGGDNLNLYWK